MPHSKCGRFRRFPTRPGLSRCLVIAAATLSAWFPATAGAVERGVTTDFTWGASSADVSQEGQALQDLQARWARIEISWSKTETTQGRYSSSYLSTVDNAVNVALASGSKIVMFVYGSPTWETGSSNTTTPPRDPNDYATFVRNMVTRYAGRVAAWEIWNEENTSRFWSPSPNPAQYATLLRTAYPAVKAADPNAKVLFGGLATNDWGFLEGAYAAQPDIGHYFDALASHPYALDPPGSPGGIAPPDVYWRDGNGRMDREAFPAYRELRQTMLAHGDDKPLWFTEFGWATYGGIAGVTDQTQADYLTLALRCMEQDPYVQVATWYELRNNYWAQDALDWEDQLGLLTTSFAKKPAYFAFKNYSSGSCTYRDITPAGQPAALSGQSALSGTQTPASGTGSTATASTRRSDVRFRIRVRISRLARAARASQVRARSGRFAVLGQVFPARRGTARLDFERKVGSAWRRVRSIRLALATGAFSRSVSLYTGGQWRLRATFTPSAGTSRVASSLTYFHA